MSKYDKTIPKESVLDGQSKLAMLDVIKCFKCFKCKFKFKGEMHQVLSETAPGSL